MKFGLRSPFDPAVRLMNRLSYPQKFAVTGVLFALPLFFVTALYISSLSEKVEISRKAQSGSRALRLMVPIWRTLCDHRRMVLHATLDATADRTVFAGKLREALDQHLENVANADSSTQAILAASAHWEIFQNKLQALKNLLPHRQGVLNDVTTLSELIVDQFGQCLE